MPKTLTFDWARWLSGAWSSTLRGATGALIGTGGLLAGNIAGVDVTPLDYKQIGGVFLGAALAHFVIYLNAHPTPEKVEETQPPFPPSA